MDAERADVKGLNRDGLLAAHDALCREARELMVRKNHDYAGASGKTPFANFQACEAVGVCTTEQGFLVRMLDKYKRLVTFAQAGELKVVNEGFRDACVDIINYAILFCAYAQDGEEVPETATGEGTGPALYIFGRFRHPEIANPMARERAQQIEADDEARVAKKLKAMGWFVIPPLDLTQKLDGIVPESAILKMALATIQHHRPVLFGRAGWRAHDGLRESEGSAGERQLGIGLGLPIIDADRLGEELALAQAAHMIADRAEEHP